MHPLSLRPPGPLRRTVQNFCRILYDLPTVCGDAAKIRAALAEEWMKSRVQEWIKTAFGSTVIVATDRYEDASPAVNANLAIGAGSAGRRSAPQRRR
jgi:hypothetical protein